MNDYCMGALEALAWVISLIDEDKTQNEIKKELKDVIKDILGGSSVKFPLKISTEKII